MGKSRIVVCLQGGSVQWVAGDNIDNVEIVIADFDVENDWERGTNIKFVEDIAGEEAYCNLYLEQLIDSPIIIEHYFNQL
jgi:hypothetical protein